ncbi:alpha/beta hydrolase [Ciceribacter sp. L1K22]|uniref:alpha/beta hydrolase n=1 Tax=Ciceribacter sp. L1K22 TaxID=2820275 RepID=UPI001ABDBF4C|nr:alpha/beta hydrolase [Ciceribacter sp. L1K22]MBO3758664.1 alpha/beta hydrolase [Ciceribacter sp. L1K22]
MTDQTENIATILTVGDGPNAREIAMLVREADREGPTLVWLGGYRSDMTGTKAIEMDALAGRLGLKAVRFDYSGHGASGGAFRDGTISRWLEEALAVIDHAGGSEVVLVGSSMGGWVALRLVQEIARRGQGPKIAGMVLIAPAPDFTAELIEPNLSETERRSLEERGYFEEPSEYSPEPNIFTRALIEDGRRNLVLAGILQTRCPVHILQGMKDPDVPYSHALRLVEHLPADDVVLTLIRDGDHRLSRPQDIERMVAAITAVANPA